MEEGEEENIEPLVIDVEEIDIKMTEIDELGKNISKRSKR